MSDKHTTARISVEGERFEILVKPEPALDYKLGRLHGISEILLIDEIYSDASKGTRASTEKLQKRFGSLDALKIAEQILKNGELQLTTDQRRKLVEDKRKQIVAFISRNCIDPRSGAPHPPLRIEQAMDQTRLIIDPFKSPEEQSKLVIEELRILLPLKIEQMRIAIKILPEYTARSYGALKNFGTIGKEEWQSDGSWVGVLEMPAGLYGPFIDKLGKLSQGTIQTKILK
jgi:ribosome maturation protein SDO1